MRTAYTDAEIIAYSDMSWWEHAEREGLPTSVGPRRIERGPYPTARSRAVAKPARDFLSEPIDWLSLPLHQLKEGLNCPS
jgi:hypothetical protein